MDKLDAFLRRYRVTGFAYAVQKKYSDDRGGYLAALITYYGFLSIFPLLLASFTAAAYILAGDHQAIQTVERHLGSYPILGPAAAELQGKRLQGSPIALIVGVLGLVWGATGLAQAAEHSMNEAWNVPERDRPGFVPRMLRAIGWYVMFGLGIVASTFVASLGSLLHWSGGPALSALAALILNVALFLGSFWVLTPPGPSVRQLLPGAAFGAMAWTVLTGVGIGLTHKLAHTSALYGSFAPVLGLLAFLYLAARVTIYGIEANVVRSQHLWPRSLTGKDLTDADRQQLVNLACRQERTPSEEVGVELGTEELSGQPAPNSSAAITSAAARTAGSSTGPTKTASRPGPSDGHAT
jgi:YihY family inner membrane protein